MGGAELSWGKAVTGVKLSLG